MLNMLERISIVIVTYKGDEMTRICLDSLAKACGVVPQIVVVDNSPSESTRAIVSAYPNACYVESPGNPGFAGGNNRAMPFCDRPYVLLLNNDTLVHTPESLTRLVAFLDDHPDCAAVQGSGRLPSVRNTLGGCGSYLTQYGTLLSTGFMVSEDPVHDCPHPCFAVGGFFFMFRRSVLPSVGGVLFHDHFWCYYEEMDFCHRLWIAGHEVWYVPTPPIDHLLSRTSSGFANEKVMRQYVRNILFSLGANLEPMNRLKILPRFYALIAGHALVNALKGKFLLAYSDFAAIAWAWRDRGVMRATRRDVVRMRRVADRQIFAKTMRRLSFREFIRMLRSRM